LVTQLVRNCDVRVGPVAVHFVELRHDLDVVLREGLGGAARALGVLARLRHGELAELERRETGLPLDRLHAEIERETWLSALKLGELAVAQASNDPERARRTAETFAEHDVEVVAKLYEVHRDQPDAHVTVSNELRDQLARTLSEDERRIAIIKPERP